MPNVEVLIYRGCLSVVFFPGVELTVSCCFAQVRDITSNPEWERAYQYEIPVLAKVLCDGSEVRLWDCRLFESRGFSLVEAIRSRNGI